MSQSLVAAISAVPPRRVPVRLLVAAALAAAAVAGLLATPHAPTAQAVADAGAELTRLLRGMALMKSVIVAAAACFITWRLRHPAGPVLTAAYLATLAAMAAGPGLIWGMAHIVAGAVLLHAGLASLLVLFWRDPGSPAMLPRHRNPSVIV